MHCRVSPDVCKRLTFGMTQGPPDRRRLATTGPPCLHGRPGAWGRRPRTTPPGWTAHGLGHRSPARLVGRTGPEPATPRVSGGGPPRHHPCAPPRWPVPTGASSRCFIASGRTPSGRVRPEGQRAHGRRPTRTLPSLNDNCLPGRQTPSGTVHGARVAAGRSSGQKVVAGHRASTARATPPGRRAVGYNRPGRAPTTVAWS